MPKLPKPLTKSRFKLALECPTKLYYEAQGEAYRDRRQGDAFLAALADGGHQFGTLAKFYYHPDPIGQGITVEETGYAESVAETQRRLALPGRQVIAEAALAHEGYFARVDLLVKDEALRQIEIIEVKSKGVTQRDIDAGLAGKEWRPYVYDVAFQAEVAALVFAGWRIVPKLVLLDKSVPSDVDGLHQQFQVVAEPGQKSVRVEVAPGVNRATLGSLRMVKEVDVSAIVADLRAAPIDLAGVPAAHRANLPAFMAWASQLQSQGTRHFSGMSKACKSCAYRADAADPAKSGLHECLADAMRSGQLQGDPAAVDRDKPLAIDLWGGLSGSRSFAQELLGAGRAYLADVQAEDVGGKPAAGAAMSAAERRLAQVRAAQDPQAAPVICEERLAEMDRWAWPLHMIDFETSAPALPLYLGRQPYETVAFQFSHHIMERNDAGKVTLRHASQWISTAPGVFPSLAFVRQLRAALMPDGTLRGTVFRYHNHENTVLTQLRPLVAESAAPDRQDLLDFIDLITKEGPRPMVDLHRLVQEGYYSAHAGGSISLKYILPAILNDAPALKRLYASPGVYGQGLLIDSLNFDGANGHVWLQEQAGWNPYRTLPPIFGPDFGEVDSLIYRLCGDDGEDGQISHGGAAMTAFSYTQYAQLPALQRQRIEAALLRYCELDTLAMVMLVQGLMELRGLPLGQLVPPSLQVNQPSR